MVGISETKGDQWDEMAKVYKQSTVETARKPIGLLLERANSLLPFSEATGILDNGCGPGPVTARLLNDYKIPDSCSVTCCDFSDGMVKQVDNWKQQAMEQDSNSPWDRVEAFVQDATDLKDIPDSSKSHVTAGWVYFMTPDPRKCLTETKRVLKDGGVLSCSSWKGSQWMDLVENIKQFRPKAELPEIPERWKSTDLLKTELEDAGFRDVETVEIPTQMVSENKAAFIDFLLNKMPHTAMLTKDMSEDEKTRLEKLISEECSKMCPTEPLTLHGTALVAVGRN